MKNYQEQFFKIECKGTNLSMRKYNPVRYNEYITAYIAWLEKKLDYADQTIIGQKMIIKTKDTLEAKVKHLKKALRKIYKHPEAGEEITEIAGQGLNKESIYVTK